MTNQDTKSHENGFNRSKYCLQRKPATIQFLNEVIKFRYFCFTGSQ